MSNIVVDQVKGKFDFTNFEELQDQMDQYSIPDWCFTYAEDFLKHYIENMIFFITNYTLLVKGIVIQRTPYYELM